MAGRLLQPRRQTNKKRRDKKGNVHLLSAKRSTAASTFSLMLESLTGKRRMINKRQNIVRDKNSLCIKSSHSFTKQMCFQFHEILPFLFFISCYKVLLILKDCCLRGLTEKEKSSIIFFFFCSTATTTNSFSLCLDHDLTQTQQFSQFISFTIKFLIV